MSDHRASVTVSFFCFCFLKCIPPKASNMDTTNKLFFYFYEFSLFLIFLKKPKQNRECVTSSLEDEC